MNQIGKRHLPLAGAYNIRDIGGYSTAGGATTRWRTFLRADSLHKLTQDAQQELIDYGLHTIIDLRFDHELATAPNVFARADNVVYVNISLLADAAPTAVERMLPDLESIYKFILDERQAALKTVFDVMTTEDVPVLFHCTAGKDRTGLIAALLLGLAGVDHHTIADDYALTAHYAGGMFDELRAQAAAAGRDMRTYERYLEAKPEAMRNTLAYLNEQYGDVATYLSQIGLSSQQITRLRGRLLAV